MPPRCDERDEHDGENDRLLVVAAFEDLKDDAGTEDQDARFVRRIEPTLQPSRNEQQDRAKGIQFTLLHVQDFRFRGLTGRAQTALGVEFSHQGPSFGSSGYDTRYYQADANWNVVINPLLTQDNGRIPMPAQYWTVQSGIPTRPLFNPYAGRVTLNGVNYVAQHRILYDRSRRSADDPYGLIPNNPTAANPNGFSGNWNPGGDTDNRLLYLANVTDWSDGKLTTVAGVSVNTFDTVNFGPTSTGPHFTILPKRDYWGYTFGGSIVVPRVNGLRFYATVSTAGLPGGTVRDYHGQPLKVPNAKSPQPEIGLKWNLPESRLIAELFYNPTTAVKNETQNAGVDYFNAVNPAGINGRYNGGDQWINLDREANAAGLVVTAMPARHWRLRLSATRLGGQIKSTVRYAQLYNDQFHVNAGTVTYTDGTPLLIDPAGGGAPASTPLTLAMINDATNPFYASPDPDSGRILNPALITALTAIDPVHGRAATGVTGLPLSAIQYNFADPHDGVITVVQAGEKNTGINEYSLNFQNNYSFEHGPLRGLAVFFDVRTTLRNRAYYTLRFPTASTGNALQGVRELYRMPDQTVCGLGLSYTHRLPGAGRNLVWTTQLNIRNLFDNSEVVIMPNPANAAQLRARLSAPPRQFIWTNTIRF